VSPSWMGAGGQESGRSGEGSYFRGDQREQSYSVSVNKKTRGIDLKGRKELQKAEAEAKSLRWKNLSGGKTVGRAGRRPTRGTEARGKEHRKLSRRLRKHFDALGEA